LDATQPRFPLARATLVRERISTLLIDRKATDLVCSAACGTDLLALDAAGELGIQRHIVLPFEPNRFRATSVTDRPGEWGALFDQIIKEVQAAGKLTILSGEGDDDAIFATTNQVMLDEALTLAQRATSNKGE